MPRKFLLRIIISIPILIILTITGAARADEITAIPTGVYHYSGFSVVVNDGLSLCLPDIRGKEILGYYIRGAIDHQYPITYSFSKQQWNGDPDHWIGWIYQMASPKHGRFSIHEGYGYWTGSPDPPQTTMMLHREYTKLALTEKGWGRLNTEAGIGLAIRNKNVPDDNILSVNLHRGDGSRLRDEIRDQVREKYSVFLFGRTLDQIVEQVRVDFDTVFAEFNISRSNFTLRIPEHFGVSKMNLRMKIDRKKIRMYVYQRLHDRDILLLETPVALGGSGYDHALGVRRGFATPTGTFFIQRIVYRPFWYPPGWANTTTPSRPGRNNPYGLWMAELSRENDIGEYTFHVNRDSSIRIHSTNRPNSIGRYASHGCVRIHPRVADELFPAMLHYMPHKKGKKNSRGTIHPLEVPIRIEIIKG